MTKSEIQDAMSGFVTASDQTGVGVLISRLLLTAQGGTFKLDSEKYVKTNAILTLPTVEMERTHETASFDGADDSDS
jgi:hypothetical protein